MNVDSFRTLRPLVGRSLAVCLLGICAFAGPQAAVAHPLGNFTTNHLTRVSVAHGIVDLHYVLDVAEIPTVALEHQMAAGGRPDDAQYASWGALHASQIEPQLELTVDGARLDTHPVRSSVGTRPGAAGLRTLYFQADYAAPLPADARRIVFRDRTEPGRLGWKDVVLAPATEPTHELRVYPSALVGSPRTRLTLTAQIGADGIARVAADAPDDVPATTAPSVGRMDALSRLLDTHENGPAVIFGAVLLAIGLGALHALEPGHGKTLLAVSLVGARATTRQALVLAGSLTFAHTIGVLALGGIVLFAARWIVPEAVYPWITLVSGLLVATLGARALAKEMRRRRPFAHDHTHGHAHAHPHVHEHAHGLGTDDHDHGTLDDEAHALAHAVPGSAPLTFRTAVLAAASGNLAPCPAALVVLLAAISLHRVAFGMLLIVAFSLGLAATLTLLGIAVVRGASWLSQRPQFDRVARWAPLASAAAIALVGAAMVGEGLVAQGVPASVPIVGGLTFAAIVGYAVGIPHRHRPLAPGSVNA